MFKKEELEYAKSISLMEIAKAYGYTPKKAGSFYTLKEIDSLRSKDDRNWTRYSNGTGGSQIDFVMLIAEPGIKMDEAVKKICQIGGGLLSSITNKSTSKEPNNSKSVSKVNHNKFNPPPKADNYKRMYAFLIKTRGLSKEIIDKFVKKNLLYESAQRHNVVFLSVDSKGVPRHASLKGTMEIGGKRFKGDALGSNKQYGFSLVNEKSDELIVFEAPIDLMSYMDLFKKENANFLALNGVADGPLETFLQENPNIKKIKLALDQDEAGKEAMEKIVDKFIEREKEVEIIKVVDGFKDWNEILQHLQRKKIKCK